KLKHTLSLPASTSLQIKHPYQGQTGIVTRAIVERNTVDHITGTKVFKRPEEVLGGDAEHSGADTDARVKRNDPPVLERLPQAVDQVDFRADSPFRTSGSRLDRFDHALGRTDLAGGLGDFKTALGVNDNTHARMLATDAGNLLRRKPLVHRAIALPKNDPGLAKRFRSVSSE